MKNIKLSNKLMSLALVLVMLNSLVPMTAFASEDTVKYVALGDSISTGYGLSNITDEGFTYLIAKEKGYDLTNLAVDGNTSAGVLSQLEDESVRAFVAEAEVITLTVGGNDMVDYLCEIVVDQYNASQTKESKKINSEQLVDILSSSTDTRKLNVIRAAMKVLTPSSDQYVIKNPEYITEIDAFIDRYNQIMSTIKELNPDVKIIAATQYNPYAEFKNASFKFIISISLNFAYQAAEDGVTALNTAIKNNAENGGYLVADVKSAFDEAYANGVDPYVADPSSMELDFHPNKAGHRVLADEMKSKVPEIKFESGDTQNANTTIVKSRKISSPVVEYDSFWQDEINYDYVEDMVIYPENSEDLYPVAAICQEK